MNIRSYYIIQLMLKFRGKVKINFTLYPDQVIIHWNGSLKKYILLSQPFITRMRQGSIDIE
jgi:hypothetical protein